MSIRFPLCTAVAALLLAAGIPCTQAGPLRDWLAQRGANRGAALDTGERQPSRAALPDGARRLRDVAYGDDPRQRMDVYLPAPATIPAGGAPLVVMVHGGGWRRGAKALAGVIGNKLAHWLPRGAVFVSVNYRMLPDADLSRQAGDVAAALATVERLAPSWGADPGRIALIGHSAGAHLVALLAASPERLRQAGARPPRVAVLLDSAALDVARLMQAPHLPLYDEAFGSDPAFWQAVSPTPQLSPGAVPFLAVCSSRRRLSCAQAQRHAERAASLGVRGEVLEQDLTHAEINATLGAPGAYTDAVDAFLDSAGLGFGR
ncbi:MAG: alpha/beta hydrolase [Burkholderiaceae bacterium]